MRLTKVNFLTVAADPGGNPGISRGHGEFSRRGSQTAQSPLTMLVNISERPGVFKRGRMLGLFLTLCCLAWIAPSLQAQVTQPIVAIHDSELTRALETMAASNGTPSGPGTTGNQWWPTNWHYFVMPTSVEEALRADGTPFTVVSDSGINNGTLLTNGVPKYPILISLASEAIQDSEIAQFTNYVAAGGYLVVGSSAFTRTPDGTSRGDFAFGNAMGVHMVNTNLTNWGINTTFTKQFNHRIVSHIPAGVLSWAMPNSADETFWGSTSPHTAQQPSVFHLVWQVQASDATVVALGDNYPYLLVKPYGKGCFIYVAAMQPIIGHSGWAPGMYAYMTFRKVIEWAFESANLSTVRLSPWPYQYDSAFMVRHDLENYSDEISNINYSAQFEAANGAKGDYYFCTGTFRVDMPANGYPTNSIIANFKSAVTNYGATIGPHNGGLQNPNYPTMAETNFDFWHWGPDEALSIATSLTNNGVVYPNGQAYAAASLSNAFLNVETWLSGVESSNMRSWAAPYFNGTRDGSFSLQSQLGVKVDADEKDSCLPSWVFSTTTSGQRYGMLNIPVSDWFVNPGLITYISHSLEAGHNQSTMQSLVDFYYSNGLLINLYSHTLSASSITNGGFPGSLPGQSGGLEGNYVTYGMNTNLHPRIWPTSATNIYAWWLQRSNAVINVTSTNNGAGVGTTTVSISGASNPNTAVELRLPGMAVASGLQVTTNGVLAGGASYRTNGQVVKILVGTTVTNAVVSYTLGPGAVASYYSTTAGTQLSVAAPGVLANDAAGLGGSLTATLVNNVTNGSLTLNSDGSFTYTPSSNYVGNDSFTYDANNGLGTSSPATVTIAVQPAGTLFYDNFVRSPGADPLAPWQVPVGFGSWGITNGFLQATGPAQNYGFAYLSNNWTDYNVLAQLQFSSPNAYGGGIGGRLNPTTGTHYAAWVYPSTTNLQLVKFTSWGTFTVLANVNLGASVGTNSHTLQLGFLGNQISVSYDGTQMIGIMDGSGAYLSGGAIADMWTDGTPYVFSLDNFVVTSGAIPPVANNDSYTDAQGQLLSVSSPGVLGNDSGGSAPLTAVLLSGTSDGALNLNANGSFTYAPTNSFFGTDTFTYEATDGHTNSEPATVTITVNQAPLPVVNPDSYSFTPNVTLSVPAPGVLGNDSDPNGSNLVASLVSNAAHGTVTLNANGSFTYVPNNNFHGNDSFSYLAYDGLNNSATVVVTLNDSSAGILFYDSFARSSDPGPISPWLNHADSWTVTGGTLQGGPDTASTYGNVYLTNNWTNYSVQAQVQFSTSSAYGCGVGGRLNTNTGAHYAAWLYPEGSSSGSPLTLKLVKFTDWADWGYDGVVSSPIASASLSSVGTNVHTIKLAFFGNQIAVYFDGSLAISTTDADTANPPYSNGGVSIDMWTYPSPYVLSVDNVTVSTLAVDNNYTVTGAGPLIVSSPGVLANDTEVFGGNLAAALVSSPTNGTLNSLNPNGGFTYTPTNSATYDSFTYQANDGSTNLGTATVSITHIVQGQTITFGALTNQTYGNAPFALTATASSGLPVSYSIQSGPATVTNGTVTLTGAGLVSVVASQAGNATYTPATNVTQSFTVNKASLTVTANNQSRLYGATNPVFTASYSGFVNGDTNSALSGAPSVTCTATTNSPVAGYTITAALGTLSAANYAFTFVNGTLTVNPATITVTANSTNRLYGATNPVFTANYTGFVNGQNSSVLSGNPSLTCPATTNSPVGGYTITAAQGTLGAANYTFGFVNGTLTVGHATLLVAANNQVRAYEATNPVLTYNITGFLGTDTVSVVSGTPAISTTATSNSPVGPYPITVAIGTLAATNYNFSFTNGTLTVGQATLLVTASNQFRLYESANPTLTYGITGFLGTDTVSVVSGTPTISTTAISNSAVGPYPITVTNGTLAATNYSFSFSNGTLTVGQATLLVTASNQFRAYEAANPALTYGISGFLGTDTVSVVSGTPAVSTTAISNSPVGSYPITPTNGTLAATNYNFTFSNGTLTVGQATLLVTASNQFRLYEAANPTLTYGISGFLGTDTVSVVSGTAAISTTAISNSPVGPYPIAVTNGTLAAQNYNFNYANGTLTVGQAALLVSADNQVRPFGATNPVLTYTISGFLGTDTVAVVSGTAAISTTAVTNSPAGPYPITVTNGTLAAQNYSFNFANGTLNVGQATLLVSADNQFRAYGSTNPVLTYTISGFLGTDTVSVVSGTAVISTTATTNSPVGPYPITVTNGTLAATNYVFSFTNGTLTVGQASLLVSGDNQSRLYGASNPVLTYTISGYLGTDTVSVVSGTAAITTSATTNSPVGPYAITVTNGTLAATNYNFNFASGTLTVSAASLGVTANSTGRIYGQTNPVFTASYSGFVNGDTAGTALSGNPSLTTSATTNSPAGMYTIVAAQDGLTASNYVFTFTNGTLTVGAASLGVTANSTNKVYGQTNPVFTASYSGFVNGDTAGTALTGNPSLTTVASNGSPVGTYTIVAAQDGLTASNYVFTFTNGTLTVGAASLGVTANSTNKVYGQTNPVFTASYSGFVNGDTAGTALSGNPSLTTIASNGSPVGTYAIVAAQDGLTASNYVFTFTNGTLTVGAASLGVTANSTNRVYGQTNPVFTATYSGFVNGDTAGTALSGNPSLTTSATTNSPAGMYTIVAAQDGLTASNYVFTFTNGTLTVGQATLLVTASNQFRLYEAANPVLTYGISGFLGTDTVSVVSGTPAISTTAISNSPVGPYPITVTNGTLAAMNYSFNFANGTLTVGQATLLVSGKQQSRLYEAANPAFSYSISGFLGTDTVSVVSGGPSLSTTAISNSPVGNYPIVVTNGTLAAVNYNFSFTNGQLTVSQATLQVTASNLSRPYGVTNPVLTYSISGFLGTDTVAVVSGSPGLSTTATTSSPVGAYPITATDGTLAALNYNFNPVNGTLTVTATAPVILGITNSGTNFIITWSALSNATYRVEYVGAFPGGTNWQSLAPDITATNVTASAVDSTGRVAHRFYRVMVLP
jgi:hypothetical protein